MSAFNLDTGLTSVLFGKTRRAVLSLLFNNPDESFYLREIARRERLVMGALQREVRQLSDVGIIRRSARGKQVFYQANPDCPIFDELKSLIIKTVGVGDILKDALNPLIDRIHTAFVFGSMASAQPDRSSDVDLMVIGNVSFAEVVSTLSKAQEKLSREINPTVYPPDEFKKKLDAGHHFLRSIFTGKKFFIIGDANDLDRLAEEPVVD